MLSVAERVISRPRDRLGRSLVCVMFLGACARPAHHDANRERPEPSARVGYGTAMADVARRFEVLGRAATAGRFALADYELGEIVEQFEETLPHASQPREGHPEVLPRMTRDFLGSSLPDLRRALATRDRNEITEAFVRTAAACNGCHRASGHGFIEVPLVAGRGIPNTDSVEPPSPPPTHAP